MHIRIRNKVAQLIRTSYDADRKKPKNTIVGRVRLANPVLDAKTRAALSEAEIAEFDSWALQQQRAALLEEELSALTLANRMMQASVWLKREGDTAQARLVATNILSSWQSLRRTMKTSGLSD